MKSLFLVLLTGLAVSIQAAEPKASYTYEGAVTGVVCISCKEHITAALTQKLPGTVSVDIKPGDKPDAQKLVIVSTNEKVTKEAATQALGAFAKNYEIVSLAKKQ